MIDYIDTLITQFIELHKRKISNSPSMSNPSTYDFYGIIIYLNNIAEDKQKLNKNRLDTILTLLKETNYCYYQPSQLREPIRINNCKEIEICNKLMEELC